MSTLEEVNAILDEALALDGRAHQFDHSTPLLGAVPEFDSMAVVSLVTAIEERFGITVQDDDISPELFETVGALVEFIDDRRPVS